MEETTDLGSIQETAETEVVVSAPAELEAKNQEPADSKEPEATQEPEAEPTTEELLEREQKKSKGYEKSLKKEIRKRQRQNDRIDALEERFLTKDEPKPLDKEQFASEEEFTRAVARDEHQRVKDEDVQVAKNQAKVMAQYKNKVEDAIEDGYLPEDFREVTEAGAKIQVGIVAGGILSESSQLLPMQYFLSKNPDEAEALRGMGKGEASRYIGRLESKARGGKLNIAGAIKETKPSKKASVTTPKVSGATAKVSGDPNKMGPAEFDTWYNNKFRKRMVKK